MQLLVIFIKIYTFRYVKKTIVELIQWKFLIECERVFVIEEKIYSLFYNQIVYKEKSIQT